MQVTAFSTPHQPDWRWRIVNYAGETIEESHGTFATIALAVADGKRHLGEMPADRSVPPGAYRRSTSHLRGPRANGAR